jgi:hypothetical protein
MNLLQLLQQLIKNMNTQHIKLNLKLAQESSFGINKNKNLRIKI